MVVPLTPLAPLPHNTMSELQNSAQLSQTLLWRLSGRDLGKLSTLCSSWRQLVVAAERRWEELLGEELLLDYNKSVLSGDSVLGSLPARLWYLDMMQPYCRCCKRELKTDSKRRCLCLAWRGSRRFRLCIASLSSSRCGDGSFTSWDGHQSARELTSVYFDVTFKSMDNLTSDALSDVDLLVVHTTSATVALRTEEQVALQRFIHKGGTALLNCFSQWTMNGGAARELVEWLGIKPRPGAGFGRRRMRNFRTDKLAPEICTAGPFCSGSEEEAWNSHLQLHHSQIEPLGAMHDRDQFNFVNSGETEFDASESIESGQAIPLLDIERLPVTEKGITTGAGKLLWFPRSQSFQGQVLVCSNMHWLADSWAWNGGTFTEGDNRRLWINLCAISCSALQQSL